MNTPANNTLIKPVQQTSVNNTLNLLDEIFSGSSSTTTNNTIPQQTNKVDFFNMGSNPQPSTNSSSNILDMFGKTQTQIQSQPKSLKDNITPFNIDTDTFGELWTSCPFDEISEDVRTRSIKTPEEFFKIISSEANFKPVQVIGMEAIAAGKYKNKITLVHTSLNGDNTLSMLIKCYDQSLVNELGAFLKTLLATK